MGIRLLSLLRLVLIWKTSLGRNQRKSRTQKNTHLQLLPPRHSGEPPEIVLSLHQQQITLPRTNEGLKCRFVHPFQKYRRLIPRSKVQRLLRPCRLIFLHMERILVHLHRSTTAGLHRRRISLTLLIEEFLHLLHGNETKSRLTLL